MGDHNFISRSVFHWNTGNNFFPLFLKFDAEDAGLKAEIIVRLIFQILLELFDVGVFLWDIWWHFFTCNESEILRLCLFAFAMVFADHECHNQSIFIDLCG